MMCCVASSSFALLCLFLRMLIAFMHAMFPEGPKFNQPLGFTDSLPTETCQFSTSFVRVHPQRGSFVTCSFREALATRSPSARQSFVSIVFVFAILGDARQSFRQTLAKRLSKTTSLDRERLDNGNVSVLNLDGRKRAF